MEVRLGPAILSARPAVQVSNTLPTANCRFEHPGANQNQNQNPFGAPSSNNNNRFGALSNTGGGGGWGGGAGGGSGSGGAAGATNPYKITKDGLKLDLADERPPWILSSYGPGKDAPEQLFGGYPREQSLEEVRLYVMGSANPQQAVRRLLMRSCYAQTTTYPGGWRLPRPRPIANYLSMSLS